MPRRSNSAAWRRAWLLPGRTSSPARRRGDGAARTVEGRRAQGLLLAPTRTISAVTVIGAWRWLPDHDLGVAVEMEAGEAYAPLTYLQIGFGLMILLMGAWSG
jgi:hypothetical protein